MERIERKTNGNGPRQRSGIQALLARIGSAILDGLARRRTLGGGWAGTYSPRSRVALGLAGRSGA